VWPFVLAGLVAAALLLMLAEYYRASHAQEQAMLPVTFEHIDHTATGCAQCHHNFIDESGGGTCYNCHKYSPDVIGDMEQTFHDFCFDCHVSTRLEGEDSGPMRECSGCH